MIELSDHPVGLHWAKKDCIGYVNVPKCSSTTMKVIVRTMGYSERKPIVSDDLDYFTVIRDPWSRYLSGVAEYVCRHYRLRQPRFIHDRLFKSKLWNKYNLDQHFETDGSRIVFDAHTVPQYIFLEPFENTTLFKMNQLHAACEFIGYEGKIPHKNPSGPQYRQLVRYLAVVLRKDTQWYKTWEEVHEKDIDMYNSITG